MSNTQGEEYWQGHLAAWQSSGQTQVDYCARHGLNLKTFARRLARQRKQHTTTVPNISALTLVPIRLKTATPNPSANPPSHLHLYSPGGWHLECPMGDTAWLSDLLRQLP